MKKVKSLFIILGTVFVLGISLFAAQGVVNANRWTETRTVTRNININTQTIPHFYHYNRNGWVGTLPRVGVQDNGTSIVIVTFRGTVAIP